MAKGNRFKYVYDIYDKKIEEVIMIGRTAKDLEEDLGIKRQHTSIYERDGTAFRGRYNLINKREITKCKTRTAETNHVMNRWEEMRIAAKILKEGRGEIVKKDGKRFVEVIR